jgi:hypothetical protein
MNVRPHSTLGLCLALLLAAASLIRAEDVAKIEFKDPLGVVEFAPPPLGNELQSKERELAPRLSKELRFTTEEGPAAVFVSTRVRPDLPKDDRLLERLEPKYQGFRKEHGMDDVVVEFRGKSPHRTLEFAVAGGEYQEMFPYVVGGHIGVENPPKSITISQFYVDSGRLFEMALFLPNADKVNRKDLFARARAACDQWRSSVAVKQ